MKSDENYLTFISPNSCWEIGSEKKRNAEHYYYHHRQSVSDQAEFIGSIPVAENVLALGWCCAADLDLESETRTRESGQWTEQSRYGTGTTSTSVLCNTHTFLATSGKDTADTSQLQSSCLFVWFFVRQKHTEKCLSSDGNELAL